MKNKGSIDTYTTFYGIDLVVASVSTKLEDLKKLFSFSNGELDDDIQSGCATTAKVIRKKDNAYVALVKFNRYDCAKTEKDKLAERIKFASHEATHVALDIYAHIGSVVPTEDITQEPFAYLPSYLTGCIYTTFCKK